MAIEASRETSVRRIKNPDDPAIYVDLKVIDRISFYDGRNRGQVTEYNFRNDPSSGRQVTPATITSDGSSLQIEIIRKLFTYNGRDNGQATDWAFFGNDTFPPVHIETRDDKVYADGGTNLDIWIKVRRIIAAKWYNPQDRGQELEIRLDWSVHDDYTGLTPLVTEYDDTSINPPWRLDPFQQIIDVSWDAKYLAVFYSGNRIAAIPMGKLGTDPTPVYDEAASGSWDAIKLKTMQVKLETDFSVIMFPIKVDEVTSGGVTTYTVSSDATFHQFHVVHKSAALKYFSATHADRDGYPFINGASGTYYTTRDVFGATSTSVSLTTSHDSFYGDPYAISATGDYYFALSINSVVPMVAWAYAILGSDPDFSMNFPADSGMTLPSYPTSWVAISYTTATDVVSYTGASGATNYTDYDWTASASGTAPWAEFSQVGGLDVIATPMKAASITASAVNEVADPALKTQEMSSSFAGISFHDTWITGDDATDYGLFVPFPYSKAGTSNYWYMRINSATATLHTPYGTYSGTPSLNGMSSTYFWLHVSNGKHLMQGAVINGTPHLFFDGSDWTPTGIALSDINTVVMDMPLSRIQQLAPPPPP